MPDQVRKSIFFLGIGGIGMSGLARWYQAQGAHVSGYDKTPTPLTRKLEAEGIQITYELEVPAWLQHVDQVIYTPAVPLTHPVISWAREKGILLQKRAEALGSISEHKNCLAVAGTHGKTSVSSLLSVLLKEGGLDPLAFVGGIIKQYETNFLPGQGNWMVAEADEYDRSFLQLHPAAAVITAADPDHLDIYENAESFTEGFLAFAARVNPKGILVLEERIGHLADRISHPHIVLYGESEQAQARFSRLHHEGLSSYFDYSWGDIRIEGLKLSVPGKHNVSNATAAITLALQAGVEPNSIASSLAAFNGVARRMDLRVASNECVYIDDYAHHPEEIQAVLKAVRELFPLSFLRVAFQPHLYSRTRDFASGFAQSLSLADEVILMDIYPAREEPIAGVTSEIILTGMVSVPAAMCTREELPAQLTRPHTGHLVMMTLGAGDIDTLVPQVERLIRSAA